MTDKMKKLNIEITESGEDMYIGAIARHKDVKENKILFYEDNEFEPYPNEYIYYPKSYLFDIIFGFSRWAIAPFRYKLLSKFTNIFAHLRKFWHLKIRKFIYAAKIWKNSRYYKISNFNLIYGGLHPLSCVEIFPDKFSVRCQLHISDPEGLAEDGYLVPSNKYLSNRVWEYISQVREKEVYPNDEWWEMVNGVYQYEKDIVAAFLKWREEMLNKGLEIEYIAELNT